jgi:hypothetical protein
MKVTATSFHSSKCEKALLVLVIDGGRIAIFYYPFHVKILPSPDADIPDRARQWVKTPGITVTLFWNPISLHAFDFLLHGNSFDATYFIDHGLTPIGQIPALHAAPRQK